MPAPNPAPAPILAAGALAEIEARANAVDSPAFAERGIGKYLRDFYSEENWARYRNLAETDIPALLAEVERLNAEVATLRSTKGTAAEWEADHQRAALESVGLAEEFPFGCDAINYVAEALVASRAEVARLADAERVAWCMERGFRFLAEVKDLDPGSDSAGDLSRSWAPFIVLLETTDIDGFGWVIQLKNQNRIEDLPQLLMDSESLAEISAHPAWATRVTASTVAAARQEARHA